MNAETLIRDEASKFLKVIESYEHDRNRVQSFKSDLTTALFDYYDNIDKLIFLYEISKQVDKFYDKHLLKCKYKDSPEKCPTNLYYVKCKFFVEQEIRELNPTFEFTI